MKKIKKSRDKKMELLEGRPAQWAVPTDVILFIDTKHFSFCSYKNENIKV